MTVPEKELETIAPVADLFPDITNYQVGGSLAANYPYYVERQADQALAENLLAGHFCYVFNCRQMGKSSLRVRAMQQLTAQGRQCVSIDITSLGTEADPKKWYNGIITQLYLGLPLAGKVKLKPWLRERDHLSPIQKLREFLELVILTALPDQAVTIFVDEIDKVLSLPFSLDDFFSYIRFCYNQRAENTEYQRLSFALFGVATPNDLIDDKTQTPFNIGQAIELTGFFRAEAAPLQTGFPTNPATTQALLTSVLTWTGGQPFLTQKLCQLIVAELQANPAKEIEDVSAFVQSLVETQVIHHWQTQDEPVHFRTIGDRLLGNEQRSGQLLGIYQEILTTGAVDWDNSDAHTELRLTGLVVKRDNQLVVYNPIYKAIFNPQWVSQTLAQLRPYSVALQAWVDSDYQDDSRLLRGQALQEALMWAGDKSLSALDNRYLRASQTQEQATTQKVNAVLSRANQKAQRMIGIGFIVLFVSLGGSVIAGWQAYRASQEQQLAELGTKLQREGQSAQKQFRFDQLSALITASNAGNQLLQAVKPGQPLKEYPATSPIVTLQTIINNIAEKNRFSAHTDGVNAVVLSPNQEQIASVGNDGQLRLWSLQGQPQQAWQAHDEAIYDVAYTPDGDKLVTASQDQTIKLWTKNGQRLQTLKGHTGSVYGVAFSPDGQLLASASRDGKVRIWDVATGKLRLTLLGGKQSLDAVEFSPDGQTIAAVSRDGQIRLWDRNGKFLRQFGEPETALFSLSWHPEGTEIAVGADDGQVYRWSRKGELQAILSGHDEFVTKVAFSSKRQTLISISSNGRVIVWDSNDKPQQQLQGYPDALFGLAVGQQGNLIVTGAENGQLTLWDVGTKPLPPGEIQTFPSAFPTTQSLLAAIILPQRSEIFFSAEGQGLRSVPLTANPSSFTESQNAELLTADATGRWIAGQVWDRLNLWSVDTGELISSQEFDPDLGRIYQLALRVHQEDTTTPTFWLTAATRSGKLWLGNIRDGKLHQAKIITPHKTDPFFLRTVSLSPTQPRLAIGSEQGELYLYDFDGQQYFNDPQAHGDRVTQVQFSPDGQYLLSASRDGSAKLWSAQGEFLKSLSGDPLSVEQIAWSSDSQKLATASNEGRVRIWNVAGEPLGELMGKTRPSLENASSRWQAFSFNHDGSRLIGIDHQGNIETWPILDAYEALQRSLAQGCAWLADFRQISSVEECE